MEELRDMNLEAVATRMAEVDALVEGATEVAQIDEAEEMRKLLQERKAELEELERRKANAKAVAGGAGNPVETKGANTMEYTTASPEYRSAFFKKLMQKPLTEAEERAITQVGGNGVMPTSTANELVSKMALVAPLLSEITLSRAAGLVTIGTMLSRDDAYQHAEGATITESTDVLAYVTLAAYEYAKIVPVSKSMQAMSVDAFEAWLIGFIYEDVATQIENAIICGTGTNEPGGLASITLTSDVNLISTTANIDYDDVCTLLTMPAKGFRKKGKFLCNYSFLYGQLAQIKDTQKRPIFVESLKDDAPGRLLGREVLVSDEVPDNTLWYGDFTKIFGNLNGEPEVELSEHSSFRKGLIDYRGFAMFDCKVAAPRAFAKFKKN